MHQTTNAKNVKLFLKNEEPQQKKEFKK